MEIISEAAIAAAREAEDVALASRLEVVFRSRSAADWFRDLDAAGVPCEVSDCEASRRWWTDPEAAENDWVVRYPHPMVGELGQVGLAFSFSKTPARIQGAPPLVGAHTVELLSELASRLELLNAVPDEGAE